MFFQQRLQEEKRERETEIKRRETERKIRHEKLARDGKKSFFELDQNAPQGATTEESKTEVQAPEPVPVEENDVENSPPTLDGVQVENTFSTNENDLNALDYEADKDDNIEDPETTITIQRVEMEYKEIDKPSKLNNHNEVDDKSSKRDSDPKKTERRRRSRSKEKLSRDRDRRHSPKGRNDRRVYRRREFSPYRDNRRRDANRFKRNRSRSASLDRSRRQRHRDSR